MPIKKHNVLPPEFKNWIQLLYATDWEFLLKNREKGMRSFGFPASGNDLDRTVDAYEFEIDFVLKMAMIDFMKILPNPDGIRELRIFARQGFMLRYKEPDDLPDGLEFIENLEEILRGF